MDASSISFSLELGGEAAYANWISTHEELHSYQAILSMGSLRNIEGVFLIKENRILSIMILFLSFDSLSLLTLSS